MAPAAQRPELLVIVGPTGSGKSALALKIAKQFNGEIITADSRTVYIGMDIGTAKPSAKDCKEVPHWGIDLVEPGEGYSAHQFKQYAAKKIEEIKSRGNLPIIVGGTGLYVDSLLYNFEFGPVADPKLRRQLEELSFLELQKIIEQRGYQLPANARNKRHLIRTIERGGRQPKKGRMIKGSLQIGLNPPSEELKQRIDMRVERMFKEGLAQELDNLVVKYGEAKIRKSNAMGYGALLDYKHGIQSIEDTKNQFKKEHWQYARRQRTWFRRSPFIQWFSDEKAALTEVTKFLNT